MGGPEENTKAAAAAKAATEDPEGAAKAKVTADETAAKDDPEEDSKPSAEDRLATLKMKEGETPEEFKKLKRNYRYKITYNKKHQDHNERLAERLQSTIVASKKITCGEEGDVFLTKVVGKKNFETVDPDKKYDRCKSAISRRLCIIEELHRKIHVESKVHSVVSKNEFQIGFHVHPTLDADNDKQRVQKEIRKYPLVDWLVVKKSTINGAGLGVFADCFFAEKSVIGLYMGGDDGDEPYNITAGWPNGPLVRCFSLTSSKSKHERSAKTMGIQMINDPNFEGRKSRFETNAEINKDLFVKALRDIQKGEEIFVDYNSEEIPNLYNKMKNKKVSVDDNEDDESEDSKIKDGDYSPEKEDEESD